MRWTLAVMVVVGLSVPIAKADEKPTTPPTPSTLTPENDWRLAKQTGAQTKTIGVLTYYPNKGGGYTFIEGKEIVFYALPYWPNKSLPFFLVGAYRKDIIAAIASDRLETMMTSGQLDWRLLSTIGRSKMPLGGQTFYRGDMRKTTPPDAFLREDTPIAQWSADADFPVDKWSRDTPDGKFRLFITAEDRETRLKLKSIVPVLAQAPKPPASKP